MDLFGEWFKLPIFTLGFTDDTSGGVKYMASELATSRMRSVDSLEACLCPLEVALRTIERMFV